MPLLDFNWTPDKKQLRVFLGLLVAFSAIVAWIVYDKTSSTTVPLAIVGGTVAFSVLGLFVPSLARFIFVGWMLLAFPIGWVISHTVMGLVYYLVVTPFGLVMRLFGRDALHRRFDRSAGTYWRKNQEAEDISRYFRQF